ncbi:UDP-N-acetylglucosamine/UDP-glucose/GDP-mannose transporter isoform X1 [Arapaima gigas]
MNSVCRSGGGRTRLKHLAPRARGDEGLRTGGERRRGAYEAPLPLSSASAPKMNDLAPPPGDQPSPLLRFLSAAFYAASSFFIVLVNKVVLTQYRFPSYLFLGIGQMGTTIIILYAAKKNQNIHFQDFDRSIFYKIFPLPLLYVGNHITGLASTKKLSLPMFTVLRKFTILMTMVLESRILRKSFPLHLICSVLAIVFGALVAASSDLAFDLEGYTFILLNDLCTAASGVYTKKKLGVEGLGKYGVIFYNACIIVVPTLLASLYTGDLKKVMAFEFWLSFMFVFYFLVSCIMGFILMYSVMLCSHYNSALTTTVIGAIKNVAVAYIGMFVGGDYVFSWMNFIGLNICMLGGLTYSYLTFRSSSATERFDHSRAEGPKDTESLAEPNKQREKQPLAVGDGLPDSMCG